MLHVTFLAPGILRWLTDFVRLCTPVLAVNNSDYVAPINLPASW